MEVYGIDHFLFIKVPWQNIISFNLTSYQITVKLKRSVMKSFVVPHETGPMPTHQRILAGLLPTDFKVIYRVDYKILLN